MRKIVLLGALVGMILLGGCRTTTNNPEESARKYSRIGELNQRMFADDVETFFLLDQPSRLTPWYIYAQPADAPQPTATQ